jgi:hypothetical protein
MNFNAIVTGSEKKEFIEFDDKGKDVFSTPFQQIRSIVADENLWGKLLENVNKELGKENKNELMTSCVINFYLLNMLFVGKERFNKIINPLEKAGRPLTIPINIKGNKFNMLFHHIFSGNEVASLNENYFITPLPKQELDKLVNISEKFISNIYNLYLNGNVDRPALHNYNHPVIQKLESEIEKNKNKVSEDCSFIYHVAITTPEPNIALYGTQDDIKNNFVAYSHAFILEQYYSPSQKKDFLRLHHAWKNTFSVAKHYEKYDDWDEGCLDTNGQKKFFENLRLLHSFGKTKDFKDLKEAQWNCFQVNEDVTPPGIFRFADGIYTGKTILYATTQINPKECQQHIQEVLKNYGN